MQKPEVNLTSESLYALEYKGALLVEDINVTPASSSPMPGIIKYLSQYGDVFNRVYVTNNFHVASAVKNQTVSGYNLNGIDPEEITIVKLQRKIAPK